MQETFLGAVELYVYAKTAVTCTHSLVI